MSVDPRARRTDCSLSLKSDPAAPLRIVIQPTASGRKWTARLGDRVLCVSAWPFVKSARRLLAEGHPADTVIEMWRPNTADWALRGRLGAVAATVIDGETASRCAKNGPPARDPDWGPERGPPTVHARPRAVSGVDEDTPKRSKRLDSRGHAPRRGTDLNKVAKTQPPPVSRA
jgi:hypothetical protein